MAAQCKARATTVTQSSEQNKTNRTRVLSVCSSDNSCKTCSRYLDVLSHQDTRNCKLWVIWTLLLQQKMFYYSMSEVCLTETIVIDRWASWISKWNISESILSWSTYTLYRPTRAYSGKGNDSKESWIGTDDRSLFLGRHKTFLFAITSSPAIGPHWAT
jgi:hypothetical protein